MKFDWQTFTYDEEWLQDAACAEEEHGCDVETGLWLSQRNSPTPPSSLQIQSMMKMVRLQEILFVELRCWMEGWNLGVALEDTLTCARQRIRNHLQTLTDEQQAYFDALLVEDKEGSGGTPLRNQLVPMFYEWLTPEDWSAIAQAASQSVVKQVQSIAS